MSKFRLKTFLRIVLSSVCYYSGFYFLMKHIIFKRGGRVMILTLHRIGDSTGTMRKQSLPSLYLSQGNFEKTVNFILRHYSVIPLTDYICKNLQHADMPRNSVVLTFDDGYKDNYDNALPILRKYQIPATIFLATSFIGCKNKFWWDRLYAVCSNASETSSVNDLPDAIYPQKVKERLASIFAADDTKRNQLIYNLISELHNYDNTKIELLIQDLSVRMNGDAVITENGNEMLTWDNILELKENGITFGSHTKDHLFLDDRIPNEIILHEIIDSKRELEIKLGTEITVFAYPGGQTSAHIKTLLRESGYKAACTQSLGANTTAEDLFSLKRINVWDGTVTGLRGGFSKSVLAMQLLRGVLRIL